MIATLRELWLSWGTTFFTVALIVDVAAWVSIFRSRTHGRPAKGVWIVLVALLPVLGAAAWFILGREPRKR